MKTDIMVRTVLLVLAFVNQVLTACGKNVLPIEDETLATLLTTGFTLLMLAANMKARRHFNAVNLDGGGSIPHSFDGESLKPSRMVYNYMVRVKPKKFRIAGHGRSALDSVVSVRLCDTCFHYMGSHNDYMLKVHFNVYVKDVGNRKRKDSEAI